MLARRGIDFIRRQQKSFKVNILRNVVQSFSVGLTQQYQSIYITGLGADPIELGYVNSIGGIAGTLIPVPIGWLSDRYGIRSILLTALPLMAIGSAIFGLSRSWMMTAVALFVSTLSRIMALTVCPMICGSTLMDEERTTGMQLCDSLRAAPSMVAPLIAAYLITKFGGMNVEGIRPLYWFQSLGLIAAFLIIYRLFTDPRERIRDAKPPNLLDGLRRVMKEGIMVKRWVAYRMLSAFPMFLSIYIPLYAADVKGADQFILGGMSTASTLVILVLALPSGIMADIYGRKKIIMLMTPLYCASLLLLIHATNKLTLIAVGLLGGFYMLTAITSGAITAELVPRELLGSWYGMLGFFRGLVNIASPILGGVIWKTIGPAYVFYFLVATELLKLLILWSMPSSATRG